MPGPPKGRHKIHQNLFGIGGRFEWINGIFDLGDLLLSNVLCDSISFDLGDLLLSNVLCDSIS
jgi:hypothetical protein